ncbi:uncharacterized protein PV07_10521 [Cladophialophora immunda]|uniref:Uncharacterized protein n=1 Tax=Cladophialophora immunda TaxID=569365 RepID=A0A0D1ZAU6_9EURO|nr:uncharacterized protein PV07_10521 [Cladophialophora immunda]KIW24831.1 hypothetical protein PV07_10521 [Cladophialophora immunda]
MDYKYFEVLWHAQLWQPPSVILKSPLCRDFMTLSAYRPTPPPYAPIFIQDAINTLVDLHRILGTHIDDALSEAQAIAMTFIDRWHETPELELQTGEVHTTSAPARLYWRVKLSCMATKKFQVCSADESLIAVQLHSGEWITCLWQEVASLIKRLGDTAPPNTPTVGEEANVGNEDGD